MTATTSGELRIICADLDARPLFWTGEAGQRHGFEPEVGELLGEVLRRPVRWVFTSWVDFVPALNAGTGDAILCGQGITEQRRQLVDFTRPYAVFDESVLTRSGSTATQPKGLARSKVGASAGSTNMALAETFPDVELVPFAGAGDDVLGDMVAALRLGEIDAFVDDDVALVPLAEQPDLRIAFTVPTRNAWGIGVAKDNGELLAALDTAVEAVTQDGRLEAVWKRWMPELAYLIAGAADGGEA
ncbi:substrate-binding periplasmic protein [Streptomyces europaeiscabiei]|uniref:substrate-binding periplasmic protein n=1 Tax=Streptomyces europaeiscabiei TaxID=146819 RepID=UPI000E6A736E|nr:ABC transporter substrate-binding protein [Streptomyces europaeiscabiei]MDX3839741.1 ABC transporter substrate-binding protein [Streptomyces europaeiscabiei]